MYKTIGIIILTWHIGPFTFYILSYHTSLKHTKHKKYPTGIVDSIGDIIFIPAVNGAAMYLGLFSISFNWLAGLVAFVVAGLLTSTFIIWRMNVLVFNDWTRPEKGKFNKAGWYHAGYMFIQAAFIFYSLLVLYNNILIWIPLFGYTLMFIIRIIEVHFLKKQFITGREYK